MPIAKAAPTIALFNDALMQARADLESLLKANASPDTLSRFIADLFIQLNRHIRNFDFRTVNPATVATDYLRPRHMLFYFIVTNWIRYIFLPRLGSNLASRIFIFGLGRLYSRHNDIGVQNNTDVDINIVTGNNLPSAEHKALSDAVTVLHRELLHHFDVFLEIDDSFTIQEIGKIESKLSRAQSKSKSPALQFYKTIAGSITIIHDNPSLQEQLFGLVAHENDYHLFETFLGLGTAKAGYAKIRFGVEKLRLPAEEGGRDEAVEVAHVIGAQDFEKQCNRLYPRKYFLSPPDWLFSIKYFVNRTYDYVSAMRNLGHDTEKIGFAEYEKKLRMDPDYRYLIHVHKLMLYLQELMMITLKSYKKSHDTSYISRARFLDFMEICGQKFTKDFDTMVLRGDLLYQSDAERYCTLRAKITSKSADRVIRGRSRDLDDYPKDFRYNTIHIDSLEYVIQVPYSWADLGFFVFRAIASRMISIIDNKLIPRLKHFGAPQELVGRYAKLLKSAYPKV